jgi:hypothetical protein
MVRGVKHLTIQEALKDTFSANHRMNAECRGFMKQIIMEITNNVEKMTVPSELKSYLQDVFDKETGEYLYNSYCQGGAGTFVRCLARVLLRGVKPSEPKRTITLRHLFESLGSYPLDAKIQTVVPKFPLCQLNARDMDVDPKLVMHRWSFGNSRLSDDVHIGLHNLCILIVERYQHYKPEDIISRCLQLDPKITRDASNTSIALKSLQEACINKLSQAMQPHLKQGRVVITYGTFIKGLQHLQWPEQL